MKYLACKSTHHFRNKEITGYSKSALNAHRPRVDTTKNTVAIRASTHKATADAESEGHRLGPEEDRAVK